MTLEAAVEALARAMPGASWCVDEDGDPEPQFDMEPGELLFWPMSSWPKHVQRDAGAVLVQVWGPPPLAEHALTAHEAMLVLRCALLGTTGHADRPWAEVFLAARPRERPCCDSCRSEPCDECPTPHGDPEARTLLTRLADDLMSPADDPLDEARRSMSESKARCDLGLWLALYLGKQPCEARSCKDGQTPVKLGPAIQGHDGHVVYPIETAPCPRCAGSGLALGAHDRAMAEAGERLAVGLEQAEAAE